MQGYVRCPLGPRNRQTGRLADLAESRGTLIDCRQISRYRWPLFSPEFYVRLIEVPERFTGR